MVAHSDSLPLSNTSFKKLLKSKTYTVGAYYAEC